VTTVADPETEYVLVTEYFHPETASTGQLMTDLAVGLQDRGLDLTVYTGQPNYHSGDNERQPRESTHQGVDVRRIRAPQVRQSSLPRRLCNWAVFTVWLTVALLSWRPGDDRDRELLVLSNPPMLPPAMWLVCRLRGWAYTYVAYDLYPDHLVELGFVPEGGLVHRVWRRLTARTYREARHVVALGPAMKERIVETAGPSFDPDTVAVIHNWADGEFIRPIAEADNPFSREHDLLEPFVVLYSGNIGEHHDLETLVRAATAFAEEDVCVLIIGEGDAKDDVVALADSLGVRGETVRFLPYQPKDELPHSLTAGDVSVVTVEDGLEGVCVSSKLYTAMAAGAPVLGITHPTGDEARVIEACDAGVHVPQGDVEGVVDAVEGWRDDPDRLERQGENARAAFEAWFTRERAVDRYYALLTEGSAPETVMDSAAAQSEG